MVDGHYGVIKKKTILSRLVSSVAEVTTIYFFPKLEYNFLALTIWIYYIKITARIWINKQHLYFDYINRLLIKLFSFICISERARQTFKKAIGLLIKLRAGVRSEGLEIFKNKKACNFELNTGKNNNYNYKTVPMDLIPRHHKMAEKSYS